MKGPFRIEKPISQRDKKVLGGKGPADEEYLKRLVMLIPSEVIAIYLTGTGAIPADEWQALLGWTILCTIFVIISRTWGTKSTDPNNPNGNKPVQAKGVAISVVAFVVWVYSMGGGPFVNLGIYVPYVGALAVLTVTFLAPKIYKGE